MPFLWIRVLPCFAVHIAQEIPGGTSPLRHGVCLAFCICATDRAFAVHPFIDGGKRRLSCSCWLIRIYLRQAKREIFFRNRHIAALRTVNDRNRFSPVTLSGEYPVAQLVIHGSFAETALFDDMRCLFFQDCGLHAVPFAGIDHGSRGLRVSLRHILDFHAVFRDNLNDRNVKFLRKLKVTVVMCGNTHDRTGTVVCQYVVRQPDRSLFTVQRIDRIASSENACFSLS